MSTKEKLEERNFILECIELYETLPALWNTKCKEYSNRDKKNQQYDVLLSKYRERFVNADKEDVIKKFNSLRTNFRKELKKINDSQNSSTEDVCEPTLWYFDQMQFITSTIEPSTSQSNISYEDIDNGDIEEIDPKPKPPKKKHKSDTDHLISLACKRLSQPKNEYDLIAKTWAKDLEKMDPMQQLFAKKAISEILFEGQMGTLSRNSVEINLTYTNSDVNICKEEEYIY